MSVARIVVISELFYPEETSTGYFVSRIAEGLARAFDVTAICSRPTYSERDLEVPYRETHAGVRILRTRSTRFDKDRMLGRLINLVTFTLASTWLCLRTIRRGDCVLVLTNPPTLPPIVGLIARFRRARPHLLVHDVYPEVLFATGLLSRGSFVARLLGRMTGATYRLYDRVIVLGRDMAELAQRRMGDAADRVTIIPNWGDVDEVRPIAREENPFALLHNPRGKIIVQFSGNIGRTHDIETILAVAERLRVRDEFAFQFIGSGGKALLVDRHGQALPNVALLPRQPREMLPGMLAGAHALLIAFVDDMLGVSVPSRMYNFMASGTPIIAMAHPDSELARTVAEEDCGWVIDAGDSAGLQRIVEHLASERGQIEAREKGMRGREAAISRYSPQTVIDSFAKLFIDQEGRRAV